MGWIIFDCELSHLNKLQLQDPLDNEAPGLKGPLLNRAVKGAVTAGGTDGVSAADFAAANKSIPEVLGENIG